MLLIPRAASSTSIHNPRIKELWSGNNGASQGHVDNYYYLLPIPPGSQSGEVAPIKPIGLTEQCFPRLSTRQRSYANNSHIPFYNMLIVLAENWIVLDENCFNTTLMIYSSEFSKKKMRLHELRVKDNSLSLEVITSESESLYQAPLVINDLFSGLPWMQHCEARSTRSFTLKILLPLYSRLI
jgi:hypothetical protein